MHITDKTLYLQDDHGGESSVYLATVKAASKAAVDRVLKADPNDEDGRSQWVWVRLQNGELILGVFPQGDTYFECEDEAP